MIMMGTASGEVMMDDEAPKLLIGPSGLAE